MHGPFNVVSIESNNSNRLLEWQCINQTGVSSFNSIISLIKETHVRQLWNVIYKF